MNGEQNYKIALSLRETNLIRQAVTLRVIELRKITKDVNRADIGELRGEMHDMMQLLDRL